MYNRPFAASGHIVQNHTCWWASLRGGTSKTMQLVPVHLDLPLLWKSHCATCSPACVILYHVTRSCKGPIILSGESMICESYLTLDCVEVQTSPTMFKLEMCITTLPECHLPGHDVSILFQHSTESCLDDFLELLTSGNNLSFSMVSAFLFTLKKSHLFLTKQLYGPNRTDDHTASFYSKDLLVLHLRKCPISISRFSYKPRFELSN